VWVHEEVLDKCSDDMLAMPEVSVHGLIQSLDRAHARLAASDARVLTFVQLKSYVQPALRAYMKVATAVAEHVANVAHPPSQRGHSVSACAICAEGCMPLLKELDTERGALRPDMPGDAHAVWDAHVDGNFALSHFAKCGHMPTGAVEELDDGLVGGVFMKDVVSRQAERDVSLACQASRRGKPAAATTCSDFKAGGMDVRCAAFHIASLASTSACCHVLLACSGYYRACLLAQFHCTPGVNF
jgi:hypothetical protein